MRALYVALDLIVAILSSILPVGRGSPALPATFRKNIQEKIPYVKY